ncbi:MAG: entry exclusion lipoprotein TrbK [Candidatus Thiodiazotropha weberae]|nr:entry exclusion lipoprotein TrbK [Candidatus Thiodiazotropha lotti]MCG8011414.1 entry exclusion lipoprotein TrbK [Candidatus Thiodiazotropha lotti]MCG8020902.1 entry exclusion lipoprotein TrbK [Candidatus Thiodiazotropha lotti]MCW4208068.1 entry exclusion lipoprotein TrbK [Candidatus Thiodiazotropha lotti]MCW4210879.1 entry exclusion lipoprotein TrbK [Candidatus Thiodiazotropha lotti]
MKKYHLFFALAVVLSGCSEKAQQMPEPTQATCEPQAMKQILSDFNDTQKKSFVAACKSWRQARNMKDWTYKPSAPDNY